MNPTAEVVLLDGEGLTIAHVHAVVRHRVQVGIAPTALERMRQSRDMLEQWLEDEKVVYGVTTGFGPFVATLIPKKFQTQLQENLIRSHSAQVGPLFAEEEVRAAMLLRLNAFAKGFSAIRIETANLLKDMLNAGVHPCVPQWGSVGASGDLNPSSHIALALMGEGEVLFNGERMQTQQAFEKAGLQPVTFKAKEGLALINGTTMMTGVGALQVYDAQQALKRAEAISVMSLEALLGSAEPFLAEAHDAKAHPGQIAVAQRIRGLIDGSRLVWDGLVLERIRAELQMKLKEENDVVESKVHVQNAYSLRAIPQILGAVSDALDYVTARITTEINSANDNPLFFPEIGVAHQGANFHGQPVALPMDVLCIALTQIAILSERRLNRMLDKTRSNGLSPFLARGVSGLQCGLEGVQYIATSLVAECRTLCHPASIQSIPSNEENQDVVSMGLVAARKARDVKEKVEYVLAIELLAACEALEERDREKLGTMSKKIYDLVRSEIPALSGDEVMYKKIEVSRDVLKRLVY